MSYIRCLSNPEGLYVWSDGKNVNISHHVGKPHSSGSDFTIPQRLFDGAARKWAAYHEPAAFKGVLVKEIHVDRRTGEIIPPSKPCRNCTEVKKNSWCPCRPCLRQSFKDARRGEFKIRLSYKGNFVNLWRVTWTYTISRFSRVKKS